MTQVTYQLLVFLLAALGLLRGYRSGLAGQAPSVLGFAFGVVCAHVFSAPVRAWLWERLPMMHERLGGDMFVDMLAFSAVYAGVFLLFLSISSIMKAAFSIFSSGVLDSILGAAFCTFNYLFFVSIFYNLLGCLNPYSSVVKIAAAHDGNVVEEVMALAPAVFSLPGPDEIALKRQLDEARYISVNTLPCADVIFFANDSNIS